jgi:exonuclease III
MSFSIASLNVNGMRDIRKRALIFDWLNNSKFDIIFLQECHCVTESEVKIWNREFGGSGFWSCASAYSCGVGILFRQGFNFKITDTYRDTDGRLLCMDILIKDQAYRLINIYCNCHDSHSRKQFIEALDRHLTGSCFKILGGDFNFTIDNNLDKVGGNLDRGTDGAIQIKQLQRDFSLLDIQRYLNPTTHFYTWSNGTVSCRLDRFYISESSLFSVTDTNVHAVPFSDHCAITLHLTLPHTPATGPSFWKLNVSVLHDVEFVHDFERCWEKWSNVPVFSGTWWDWVKVQIKKLVIRHSKRLAAKRRTDIQALEADLDYVTQMELENPGMYQNLVDEVKSNLLKLYSDRMDGVRIRSRAQFLDESEKPTRYFLKREQYQATSSIISHLEVDGQNITESHDILQETSKFYSELYTSEPIDQPLLDYFVKDLPTLKEHDKVLCEGPITLSECEQAIKAMNAHKTPGLDGLPKEFYARFFHLLGPCFVQMVNRCFDELAMPDSQKHGVIKILCKDPAHPEHLDNWRPISLLNVDYKILTRVLTTRLSKVIATVVHPDQTSSVPGRTILDNLHLTRNLIDYLDFKELPGILVSLDQQKAFDRVNHHYLFSVLDAFGFGPQFQQWVKLIYSDITSSVLVNGFLSPKFNLTRGVRQGCSLSPLLYNLCLEPLLIKFRQDNQIHGIPIPGEQEEVRVIAFADDVALVVTDESSVRKILVLTECFESASGTKLNRNKSFGIWLGSWVNRVDNICNLHFSRDTQKFYGILLERGHMSEQNWTKLLSKFNSTLSSFLYRDLSIRGRAVIANAMACSKLWYVASVLSLPPDSLHDFTSSLFKFVWAHKPEWVARSTMYASSTAGGMQVVNIEFKLHALHLMHLRNIIMGTSAKWFFFARYFIGFHLRRYNADLYSRTRPQQICHIPAFYADCLKSLSLFLKLCPDPPWQVLTCKNIYSLFITSSSPQLVVSRFFPAINYTKVFNNVHNVFLCPSHRELNWKIAHRILPVKFLLYTRNITRDKLCPLCKASPEQMDHLFMFCPSVQPLIKFVCNFVHKLCGTRILLARRHFLFMLDAPVNFTHTFLYIISLCKYIVWSMRNRICFEKFVLKPDSLVSAFRSVLSTRVTVDFHRFSYVDFRKYWPEIVVSVSGSSTHILF